MSIRTHFCVVQCYSQLGWPVIKVGKPIWNPDPHHGFVDAFLFSAICHALGGKRGLERPGLDVAVTALAGGELTVGDEFWARHGENGFLEALVACKDIVSTAEFRWLPQAPPQSVAKAHTLLLNSVAHHAERLESDAVVLFGWNLDIPRWAEAVVVVVPTDFGFDGWKDRDGILQEAVLQCFQERRRTVKVDLVSEDTLPQFRFRCHHTLQYLSSQVSNGNLRRAAGGLARCPPPQRRSRSPRRNFTVNISDSDDEHTHHNTTHHTTRQHNTTTRLQHHYLELREAGPWLRKLPTQLTTRCRAGAAHSNCLHAIISTFQNFYATTKQGGGCFARVLKLRLEPETSEWNARSFQMSASLVSLCSFSISVLPTVGHFYLCVLCVPVPVYVHVYVYVYGQRPTPIHQHLKRKRKRKRERKERKREREKRKREEREKRERMKGERKDKEKEKRERRKRKTDYSYSRALLGNYFQLQLQACLRRRINIALHYSRTLSRN